MSQVEQRIAALGLVLPVPMQATAGAAMPFSWVRVFGDRAYVAAHGPVIGDGVLAQPLGRLGAELTLDQGFEAARLTALAMLASLRHALGDLDRIAAWLRVSAVVAAAPGFTDFPAVANGFTDLIVEVFGPVVGPHARITCGVSALQFNLPLEIEAEVAIRDP